MLKKIKMKNSEVEQLSNASQYEFPKYATQIINLLNSNAQGTRPAVVGQMSELIQEFDGKSLEEWIQWYNERQPDAVNNATEKIYNMYQLMSQAFNAITREMVEEWVKDLVYTKTYCGLKFQSAIIAFLASKVGKTWRLANVEEEAQGIDGFIGEQPLQIKSITYKLEARLSETIDVPIVYYDKKKDGISIEYDTNIF
ncbi:MAG: MjaI family restriction endonuclease [Bacteroidaceae bacterium]|nr:MjaI family restriction endonuclease [Bacteroidaceae bacterium]